MCDIIASVFIACIVFMVSTFIHEFAHLLMCRILNCRVVGMKALFLCYDGHKWSFKLSGKNHCAFITDNGMIMKTIVAAGPTAEVVVILCSLLIAYLSSLIYIRIGFVCAAIMIAISILFNLLPMTNGDGKMLFKKERDK